MECRRVIFVSAVSSEFHKAAPGQSFQSYRDVLKRAFRILAPHYEVIVQEDLIQGFGDLLETVEHEVARSLFVIHLVGDLAGFLPEPAAIRNLQLRHPNLLAGVPALSEAVGDGEGITYTQWELYLAFHHGKRRLIFEAKPGVPRSPFFTPSPADQASQEAHRRRINATGAHRGRFHDQGDVARKSMRSFLHFRVDPEVDPVEPSEGELAEAWAHQEDIVNQLAASIKRPDPRAVPVSDPANAAAFVAAVRATAERWRVNLATIVDIAARHEELVRTAAADNPTAEAFYEEAFAELALGDYTASRFSARRAANIALQLLEEQPQNELIHRENAQNALLLLHEAAKAAHDVPAATAALEEAGGLIDKNLEPVRWADFHGPLAEFLLDHANFNRAEELISELIDIREDHQGENHLATARALMLWAKLLYAYARYRDMEGVVARAERIFASQVPANLYDVAVAMSLHALALKNQNRMSEAEPLMRRGIEIAEQAIGADHPGVAVALSNLALLLQETKRLEEAEQLMNRALAIHEESYGPEHPAVAIDLNSLALLLKAMHQPREGEPLMRRCVEIFEQSYGVDHPKVAIALSNLAGLLQDTNQLVEAEPLLNRALAIHEQTYGPEHPAVATDLNNLGQLLQDTNRLPEAERSMRRALAIEEKNYGPDDARLVFALGNLALLLMVTHRLSEAKPLMRRALENVVRFAATTGHEHPYFATAISNYRGLLRRQGYSRPEIQAELNSVVRPLGMRFGRE